MMNRQRIIFLGLLVLTLILLLIWLWPKASAIQPIAKIEPAPILEQAAPAQPSSLPEKTPLLMPEEEVKRIQQEKRRKVVEQVEAMLNTPITFYGKVVDQKDDPVPTARVGYSLLDKFAASGSNSQTVADQKGYFEISGVKGAVLGVNVSKEGYYQIHNVSNQRFAYGMGPDGYTKSPPTKDNPAVFVLHKMGETEPLIRNEKNIRIPRTGNPVEINLATGRMVAVGQGDLRVEAWTNDQAKNERGRYDWKCRISVPGGGLVERKDDFAFEAAVEGYQPSEEIVMSADAERWNPQASRQYFIKLADNRYARIEFEMIAGGDHFFSITSYLNPTPGSRNLEYDPSKVVSSTP
jgi:hypothetical protein